jgi:hypothetical protein
MEKSDFGKIIKLFWVWEFVGLFCMGEDEQMAILDWEEDKKIV